MFILRIKDFKRMCVGCSCLQTQLVNLQDFAASSVYLRLKILQKRQENWLQNLKQCSSFLLFSNSNFAHFKANCTNIIVEIVVMPLQALSKNSNIECVEEHVLIFAKPLRKVYQFIYTSILQDVLQPQEEKKLQMYFLNKMYDKNSAITLW